MIVNGFLKAVREGNPTISKDDEYEFMGAIAESFKAGGGAGTYLVSLFTPNMIKWVNRQIELDLRPDLWGTLDEMLKDSGERLAQAQDEAALFRAKLADAQKALDDSDHRCAIAVNATIDLGETIERLRAAYKEERAARDDAELRLCRVQEVAADAWFDGTTIQPGQLRDLIS